MIGLLMEGAVRALLVAGVVGAGLRLLRVRNVLAEKAAWGLVLAAAVVMPLLTVAATRWQLLPVGATVRIPAELAAMLPWLAKSRETAVKVANEAVSTSGTETAAKPKDETAPGKEREHGAVSKTRGLVLSHHSRTERAMDGARVLQSLQVGSTETAARTTEPKDVGEVGAGVGDRFPAPVMNFRDVMAKPELARSAVQDSWLKNAGNLGWTVYLGIALLLLTRLLHGLTTAARIWKKAEEVPEAVAERFGARLKLRWSDAVATPVTIGGGVLLPEGYTDWDEEKLRVVVAHEASHVRQGDFYLQLLAGGYAALVWVSPLGWWLKHKLSELSEAISDRAGLEEARSGTQYAQILMEFAALPRPTVAGVAMAHTSNLSARIERLLNESSFKQAFAGGRRALLAVLLVPAILAATVLIRVEAASGHDTAMAPAAQATGVSHPDEAPPASPTEASPAVPAEAAAPAEVPAPESSASPAVAPVTDVAPVPPIGPANVTVPPIAPLINAAEIEARAAAQIARDSERIRAQADRAETRAMALAARASALASKQRGYSYRWSDDGDGYALITGKDQKMTFSGSWSDDTSKEIEKARKQAGGKFLWFQHNGKSYTVSDPATVAQIEAMYQPMESLGHEQAEFAKQQAVFAKTEAELAKEWAKASIPTPDVTKEMAELNAAVSKLQASQSKTMSNEEWANLEGKIGALQGKLGEIQGRLGEIEGLKGEKLGKLGELQGELGEKEGLLGEKQGKMAMEADRKVREIIEQSLKDGKAKPVE